MALKTEASGSVLLTDLYIAQKVNHEPFDCFQRETTGRGFRLNILVDMSGSMIGIFKYVSRLVAVLQRALNFPFVKVRVFGCNSTQVGVVNLYVFPDRSLGLISTSGGPSGLLPLSHAIQVAGRDLVGCRDDSHLFVISDGLPVYAMRGRTGHVDPESLQNWTHDAVARLRQQKVKVWCFMLGGGKPSKRMEKAMHKMFGSGYWRYLEHEKLFEDSPPFLKDKFLRFLRTR